MAKVHFAPFYAIKYVGKKAKEFHTSLARPRPKLKTGDIVIVDKKTAFNATQRGFGEFVAVEDVEFVKADVETVSKIDALNEKLSAFDAENKALFQKLTDAIKERDELKKELEALGK